MSLAHVSSSPDPDHVTACPFVLPETPAPARAAVPAGNGPLAAAGNGPQPPALEHSASALADGEPSREELRP